MKEREDNSYLSYNMVVGDTTDNVKCLAFEVLDYALLSAPGARFEKSPSGCRDR